jgi:hypothetical protein
MYWAAGSIPFKSLRAATNANGTFFVGGGGFTITHPSTGNYHVAFPPGTWNNGGTACFYVPQVQSIFTTSPAVIAGWTTFSDGSGVVDIVIVSGADAPLMLVFTSANC